MFTQAREFSEYATVPRPPNLLRSRPQTSCRKNSKWIPKKAHRHSCNYNLFGCECFRLTGQILQLVTVLARPLGAVHTFFFLLMLTEMIFKSNTCINFTPKP